MSAVVRQMVTFYRGFSFRSKAGSYAKLHGNFVLSGEWSLFARLGGQRRLQLRHAGTEVDQLRHAGTEGNGMAMLNERPPRSVDEAVAAGERLSALLISEYLNAEGTPAEAVNAWEVVVTDMNQPWSSLAVPAGIIVAQNGSPSARAPRSRRRRGEIERRVPAIMSESWRSNPMCGVEGA
jgi:hypothetical protein